MTLEQAQTAYDAAGSVEAFAHTTGMSRNMAYALLRRLGVKMRPRGGNYGRTLVWSKEALDRYRERRELRLGMGLKDHWQAKAVHIDCEREGRRCVIHDVPGSCECCARIDQYAGIRSLLECEGIVR